MSAITHMRQLAVRSTATSIHRGPARVSKRRTWPLDAKRHEDILGSAVAYLLSFAICFVALGFGAYFVAQWTLGMT